MGEYSGRRLLLALPTLLLVTFTTFLAFHLVPYDPTAFLLNSNSASLTSDQLRQELGLNGSIWSQYATWLGQLLHFNLGVSYVNLEPVWSIIGPRLVPTLVLDGTALIFALALSLLIRAFSANRDAVGALVRVGAAIPSFVLGALLIYIFAVRMQRLPVGGYQSLTGNFGVGFSYLILPAVSLGLGAACITLSQVGSRLFPQLQAYDLSPDRLLRSGFRSSEAISNAVPLVGLQAGVILAGTFVVEPLFGWPGIGSLTVDALSNRDYPTAQGVVLLVAIAYLVISVFITQVTGRVGQENAAPTDLYPLGSGSIDRGEGDVGSFLTLTSDSSAPRIDDLFGPTPKWVPAAALGVIVAAAILFPLFYEHIGSTILGGITGTTPIGPESYHSPTYQDLLNLDAPFSAVHPLGTDALGRDALARVVYGARAALGIGALSAGVAAVIGLLLGLLGATVAWLVDLVANTLLAFPAPILALAILADSQLGLNSLVIGLAVVQAPIFIRYARELAQVRAQAPRADLSDLLTGLSMWPNLLLAPVAGAMALAILWESMLGFLGLGLPAPMPDWGDMVASAAGRIYISPVELVGPSVAIVVTLITLGLVAENALQSSADEE